MRDEREHSLKRCDRSSRIAGNIHDQAGAEGAGNGAAHRSEGGVFQSLAAHVLAKTFEDAVANLSSGFRGHIAEGNTSATRRDYQARAACLFANLGSNLLHVIGDDQVAVHSETGMPQANRDFWPGTVDSKTLKTGIADGDDDGVHNCDFTFPASYSGAGAAPQLGLGPPKNETIGGGRNVDAGPVQGNYDRISVVQY
jgi:hypothetical protein